MTEHPLRVVASAIRCIDPGISCGMTFSLPQPARHSDVLRAMMDQRIQRTRWEQGFLLSDGSFSDRIEARKVAEAAGQLLPRQCGKDELFSEDVW